MNITDPRFQDADIAREWLETQRWPDGPVCSHCGSLSATSLRGKSHRPGLFQCNDCREQFTVTTGSVMERSKIPLNKWVLAMHLMGGSKKGMSAPKRESSRERANHLIELLDGPSGQFYSQSTLQHRRTPGGVCRGRAISSDYGPEAVAGPQSHSFRAVASKPQNR